MVYAVRALGLRFSCCVALMAAALLVLPRAALAENGWWEPPGIATTHATQGEVRAAIAKALGAAAPAYSQRVETYAVSAPGVTCSAREFVRGANFRISALLAGKDYGFGRSDGSRWRQTPTGLVHLVLSDVQGDDLDRWPTAYVSDDRSSWVLVGETREAAPAWVLLDRAATIFRTGFTSIRRAGSSYAKLRTRAFDRRQRRSTISAQSKERDDPMRGMCAARAPLSTWP